MSLSLAATPADSAAIRRNHPSAWSAARKEPELSPDDLVLQRAEQILLARLTTNRLKLKDPSQVRPYCQVRIGTLEHEQFEALWLDNQHRLLRSETLARGTLNEASVYPREVIKAALRINAAAVIFAHNHPSGEVEPSWADRALTRRLRDALALIDIRVLDHIVVAGNQATSFAERGWL